MATNRNNGGGGKIHLQLQLPDGGPYRQAYYSKNDDETTAKERKIGAMVWAAFVVIVLLLKFLCCWRQKREVEQSGSRVRPPTPRQRSEAGGRVVDRAAVELAAPVRTAAGPQLVCPYRKADGWGEGSCAVCLAEMADGEVVRVLPACLHYFHAACVDEWLRAHDTCPLCRAPLVAAPAGAV